MSAKPPAKTTKRSGSDEPATSAKPPAKTRKGLASSETATSVKPPAKTKKGLASSETATSEKPPAKTKKELASSATATSAKPPAKTKKGLASSATATSAKPPAKTKKGLASSETSTSAKPPTKTKKGLASSANATSAKPPAKTKKGLASSAATSAKPPAKTKKGVASSATATSAKPPAKTKKGLASSETATSAKPPAKTKKGLASSATATSAKPPAKTKKGLASSAATSAKPPAKTKKGLASSETATSAKPPAKTKKGLASSKTATSAKPPAKTKKGLGSSKTATSAKRPAMTIKGLGSKITKAVIRKTVSEYFEANHLANTPCPVHNRIANFKGGKEASDKIVTMNEFKKARTVMITPEKPQEQNRFYTLQAKKTLLVPSPHLRSGLFHKIVAPKDGGKKMLQAYASSQGVRKHSTSVDLGDKVHIDLVIIGSVAVSEKGYRIGRGEGYADLEFGMMVAMGAIDATTVIISTVHECQVVDIPKNVIEEHDIVVDYIVTPNNIIKCKPTKPRPTGIYWSKLNRANLHHVPVLKKLRAIERSAGKDVTLMETSEEIKTQSEGTKPWNHLNHFVVFVGGLPISLRARKFKDEVLEKKVKPAGWIWLGGARHAFLRFEKVQQAESAVRILNNFEINGEKLKVEIGKNHRNTLVRYRNNPGRRILDKGSRKKLVKSKKGEGYFDGKPAVFVKNIPRDLPISEFKSVMHGKFVDPLAVDWRTGKQFAFLVFYDIEEAKHAIPILKKIKLKGKKLRVELSRQSQNKSG